MSKIVSKLNTIYPEFDALTAGQQRILEAALTLFAEKGFASASTGSIARQAGVAEGLIFKHFHSKKELLLSLVRPLALKVFFPLSMKRIQVIVSQDLVLADLLEAVLRERLNFVTEHRHILRIMIQEIWLHPELMESLAEQFNGQLRAQMQQRFETFVASGEIRPMAFQTFLRLMISQFMGLIIPRVILFPELDWDEEREIQETLQVLIQGLAIKTEVDL